MTVTLSPSLNAHLAEGSDSAASVKRGFGGPSSVEGQLRYDEELREEKKRLRVFEESFQRWEDYKSEIKENCGLTVAFDYAALQMWAPESLGESKAFGGVGRLYGTWDLLDRGGTHAGSLVFKVEHRHRLGTDVAPQNLGFQSGYLGMPGAAFSDYQWAVTSFFWRQRFGEESAIVVGIVNISDYVDYYGMANPFTQFQNLVFLSNPTMPAPGPGLGAAFGIPLIENYYMTGGFADANGDPTTLPFDSFNEGEFFKHVEIGWSPAYERLRFDNIHFTAWHVDERDQEGVPESWGIAFSASRFIDDTWMPFLRAGYADGGASLLQKTISAGLGRFYEGGENILGGGVNWGRPTDSTLDDQWTYELFFTSKSAHL